MSAPFSLDNSSSRRDTVGSYSVACLLNGVESSLGYVESESPYYVLGDKHKEEIMPPWFSKWLADAQAVATIQGCQDLWPSRGKGWCLTTLCKTMKYRALQMTDKWMSLWVNVCALSERSGPQVCCMLGTSCRLGDSGSADTRGFREDICWMESGTFLSLCAGLAIWFG